MLTFSRIKPLDKRIEFEQITGLYDNALREQVTIAALTSIILPGVQLLLSRRSAVPGERSQASWRRF
jgi:hypothetical protein